MNVLPTDADARKRIPMATGLLDFFPLALAYIAEVSAVAAGQHHPGEPIHWDREKSTDHADCIVRHLIDRGKIDTDGVSHSGKVAWRALALLQTELEIQQTEGEQKIDRAKYCTFPKCRCDNVTWSQLCPARQAPSFKEVSIKDFSIDCQSE